MHLFCVHSMARQLRFMCLVLRPIAAMGSMMPGRAVWIGSRHSTGVVQQVCWSAFEISLVYIPLQKTMLTGQLECSFLLPRDRCCVVSATRTNTWCAALAADWEYQTTQRILMQKCVVSCTCLHSLAQSRSFKFSTNTCCVHRATVAPQEDPYERFRSASGHSGHMCA